MMGKKFIPIKRVRDAPNGIPLPWDRERIIFIILRTFKASGMVYPGF